VEVEEPLPVTEDRVEVLEIVLPTPEPEIEISLPPVRVLKNEPVEPTWRKLEE